MGSSREWDGTFETSREANRDLEDIFLDAMDGNYIGKGDDGGLIKTYADGSWEMMGPSDGPKKHYHGGVDSNGRVFGHG